MSVFETAAASESLAAPDSLESPFRGAATLVQSEAGVASAPVNVASAMESPFSHGPTPVLAGEAETAGFHDLLHELEDEYFDEAVAQLIDEAAGVHLSSAASWSSAEAAPGMAMSELEAWIEPLRQESARMLDNMAERLEGEELETLRDPELETLFESLRPDTGVFPEAFENFLGGLFNKAKSLVKGAVNLARKGISAVGTIASAPIRFLLNKLGGLAKTLLRGVLQKAIGLLPAPVQPIARTLAQRLLGEAEGETAAGSGQDLAHEFDISAANLLFAPGESEGEGEWESGAELEGELEQPAGAALSELDNARAVLAHQLEGLAPGSEPLAELEQFLPLLMAARPAIQMGIRFIGREKIVKFLAEKIAGLIKGIIGIDAARILSPQLVSTGLSALGFEASEGPGSIAGEALASTVEETVDHMLTLPAEAFEDTLRMEAELQSAFAAAAAHHIPAEFLRADLPQIETAGEGGVWVLMPRAAWPSYRYKKYSRVFEVPITRQAARAVPTADGGTVETMLLDQGVTSWPARAQVHLFETLPEATHLGHIAQFESEGEAPISEVLGELHPLTPDAASALLHEPGLGRPLDPPHHVHGARHRHSDHAEPSLGAPVPVEGHRHDHRPVDGHRPLPADPTATHPATSAGRLARPLPAGRRYFRIRLPGQVRAASARPRHRVSVRFHHHPTPTLHVHVSLSERESQELAEMLHRDQLPTAVAWLKDRYQRVLPAVLTAHIMRHRPALGHHAHHPHHHAGHSHPHVAQGHHHAHGTHHREHGYEGHAVRFALGVTEAVTQAMAAFVRDRHAELMASVQSAAQGVTFSFVFDLAAPDARTGAGSTSSHRPMAPHVQVRPGFHHAGSHSHHHHHHPEPPPAHHHAYAHDAGRH